MTDGRFVFAIAFCGAAFVLGAVPLVLSGFSGGEEPVPSPPENPEPVDAQNVGDLADVAPVARAETNDSPLELPLAESAWSSAGSLECPSTDLRMLVITADGGEPTLSAIRQALDYVGIPYSVYVASKTPGGLTPDKLSSGCRGFYQGVVLATGELSYEAEGGDTRGALTDAEWQVLRDYEAKFGVRRVAWYAYPTLEYGLQNPQGIDTGDEPIEAEYTDAGADVFSYANANNPLAIKDTYTYLAETVDGTKTTPLLTTERGDVLAAVAEHPDGRETLALSFLSNEFMEHNLVLSYGLIDWVTRGLFLGERRVYLSAQIDDFFLPNVIYGTDGKYRMTEEDLRTVLDWQQTARDRPTTSQLRLDQAFNAYGTTGIYEGDDTLTPLAKENKDRFKWINHTYKHLDWDELDYETALKELRNNNAWARSEGLEGYKEINLVTPEYSGLMNPEAMRAARDAGVRYLVGDNSKPEYDNPSPNAGLVHPLESSLLIIPRYPNNLGFDVSTPEEWVSQYNDRYRETWGRDLSYEEVLDKESDVLLTYLLRGDIDPWMFHQANLRAYDGEHTLLTDLLDRTLEKYVALFDLPILSPTQDEIGRKMVERMRYNEAGVEASVVAGGQITLTARKVAKVPVTGLRTENTELYGDQHTSYVSLEAGESVTLPLG